MDPKTGKPITEFVEGAGMDYHFPEYGKSGDMMPVLTGNISKGQKKYSDLREGGQLASTLYNIARKFNTYEPLQYDVTIPADKWESTKAVSPLNLRKDMDVTPDWVERVNKSTKSRSNDGPHVFSGAFY